MNRKPNENNARNQFSFLCCFWRGTKFNRMELGFVGFFLSISCSSFSLVNDEKTHRKNYSIACSKLVIVLTTGFRLSYSVFVCVIWITIVAFPWVIYYNWKLAINFFLCFGTLYSLASSISRWKCFHSIDFYRLVSGVLASIITNKPNK